MDDVLKRDTAWREDQGNCQINVLSRISKKQAVFDMMIVKKPGHQREDETNIKKQDDQMRYVQFVDSSAMD